MKKKKGLSNYPCRCGHAKRMHEIFEVENVGGCTGIVEEDYYEGPFCECRKYIPDNLNYIEKRYEDRS